MILFLLLAITPIAEAATKADVETVVDYMFCRKESARGCTRPITPSWSDATFPVKRLVIVHDGKRYTLSYITGRGDSLPESFEIYERTEGTWSSVRCWQDDHLDGVEDNGDQWQYDAALAAVLEYFRTPAPEPVAPTTNP